MGTVNGTLSTYKTVKSGVHPETVLGTLLFLLYVNDLPTAENSLILLFANDIKMWRPTQSMSNKVML